MDRTIVKHLLKLRTLLIVFAVILTIAVCGFQSMRAKIADLQSKFEELKTENARLQSDIENKNSEIADIKAELDKAKNAENLLKTDIKNMSEAKEEIQKKLNACKDAYRNYIKAAQVAPYFTSDKQPGEKYSSWLRRMPKKPSYYGILSPDDDAFQ